MLGERRGPRWRPPTTDTDKPTPTDTSRRLFFILEKPAPRPSGRCGEEQLASSLGVPLSLRCRISTSHAPSRQIRLGSERHIACSPSVPALTCVLLRRVSGVYSALRTCGAVSCSSAESSKPVSSSISEAYCRYQETNGNQHHGEIMRRVDDHY